MNVPFKFYILYCISRQESSVSYKELLPLVHEAYAGERQINKKTLLTHLDAFAAVGATEVVDAFEEEGDVFMKYQITEYGKSLLKYIKVKNS